MMNEFKWEKKWFSSLFFGQSQWEREKKSNYSVELLSDRCRSNGVNCVRMFLEVLSSLEQRRQRERERERQRETDFLESNDAINKRILLFWSFNSLEFFPSLMCCLFDRHSSIVFSFVGWMGVSFVLIIEGTSQCSSSMKRKWLTKMFRLSHHDWMKRRKWFSPFQQDK